MRVENLQAETTITENGARVYSPNNKPSASDIGALATNAAAESAKVSETVRNTNLGTTSTSYITIPNVSWYGKAPVGRSQMVKSDSYGLPIAANGYIFKIGARDTSEGSSWIFSTDYSGRGSRVFFGICETSNHDPRWHEVYSPNHKPTAADVGAHPTSWKPAWNDVQGKPQYALRWPNWNEISGKPGSMPPNSHTHPWSQITGQPVYTQRWPNWNEVSGKPGNLLTQTTADTRYMSKTAKPDANTLDGQDSDYYRSGMNYDVRAITVGGDANTYYPVRIEGGAHYAWGRYHISRGYHDTAPPWDNTSTHQGGLTLAIEWSGDGNWGGNDKSIRVVEFNETYSKIVAGLTLATGGLIVWLRGGGARYEIRGPVGVKQSITVYLGNYVDGRKVTYGPRKNTSSVAAEIHNKWFARSNGQLFDSGNRVYSASNKPSAGDVGAYTKGEGDGRYVRFDYSGSSEFARIIPPKSEWVRAPTTGGGFIPYTNGNSYLGTSSWRWKAVYANAIYDNNQRVYSPVNKPSPATIGAEPTLAGDRKRKITYGTGNPSGGASGDIYIQYK
ncbi:tail protein [Vibrio phage Achelous]|uniref:Tail fiber protein n=2 Tax=Thalassavirus TaxID=2948922 RepID=A0A4Y6E7M9_9CAUD|nr:tail fiber protein [Vibrio phage Achelous]YP_010102469.1 tail fiber protein [Vibrio phage Brizo]QCQ57631.1 tail protein [Vibrio phage Achelous]QDF14447.1 tail fiber protein [Vibrio phage Brizo]